MPDNWKHNIVRGHHKSFATDRMEDSDLIVEATKMARNGSRLMARHVAYAGAIAAEFRRREWAENYVVREVLQRTAGMTLDEAAAALVEAIDRDAVGNPDWIDEAVGYSLNWAEKVVS